MRKRGGVNRRSDTICCVVLFFPSRKTRVRSFKFKPDLKCQTTMVYRSKYERINKTAVKATSRRKLANLMNKIEFTIEKCSKETLMQFPI